MRLSGAMKQNVPVCFEVFPPKTDKCPACLFGNPEKGIKERLWKYPASGQKQNDGTDRSRFGQPPSDTTIFAAAV